MHRSLTTARFTAATEDYVFSPRVRTQFRPVIYMTGGGNLPSVGLQEAEAMIHAVTDLGYRVYMPSVPWLLGNSTARSRIDDTLVYAKADGCADLPPIIIGVSNGSICAMLWARDHACGGIVSILPPLDCEYLYQNNVLGLQANWQTAWSVTAPTPLPAHASPLAEALAGTLSAVPMQLYYSSDDTITQGAAASAAAGATAFLSAAARPGNTSSSVGALGHTGAALTAMWASFSDYIIQFIKSIN